MQTMTDENVRKTPDRRGVLEEDELEMAPLSDLLEED